MQQITYYMKDSYEALRINPLRSSLSIIGVVFGVASVVAMLGIGMGAQHEVEKLMAALGTRNIHIAARDLSNDDWRQVISFTTGLAQRDRAMALELYPKAEAVGIAKWTSTDVNLPLTTPKLDIFGMDPNYPHVIDMHMMAGRFFSAMENKLSFPSAVVGENLARAWFPADPRKALGQDIRISRSWFHVVGVVAATGLSENGSKKNGKEKTEAAGDEPKASPGSSVTQANGGGDQGPSLQAMNFDDAVLVPYKAATARLGPRPILSRLERIIVKLPEDLDPIDVRQNLEKNYEQLHRRAKVLTVTSADEIIRQKKATAKLFTYFLLTIALISLVVGGIGIANVMLASMVERIREVGLRRAIGAKRHDIMMQFLSEAVFICMLGGIVGGVLGIAVAFGVGLFTGWAIAIPWWGLVVAILIATVVGIASGLFPAIEASRISPIEALQGRA